jgi:hypothetical protein
MFSKITLALFGFSILSLSACGEITGTEEQAMPRDETGIISPDDNEGI